MGPRFVPMAAVRATSCLVLLTLACKPVGFSGSDPQKAKDVSAASGTGGAQSAAAAVAPATTGRLSANPSLDECSARFMCAQGLTGAAPCGVSNGQGMRFILLPNKMSQYAGVIACKTKFNGDMVYVDQPYPTELTSAVLLLGRLGVIFTRGQTVNLLTHIFKK